MEHFLDTYLIFGLAMLAAGIVAGLVAGLLGVGGGIVLVPILFYLFSLLGVEPAIRMHMAVGTSLSTVIATALSSARAHHSKGAIDAVLLRSWGPWLFGGSMLGMVVFGAVDSSVLTLIFASVALIVAMYMAMAREKPADMPNRFPRGPIRYVLGLLVGGVSTVMGIGGGTLSVPILTLFHYPIRKAVGTAAAIGLLISVPGAIGAVIAGIGHPDLPPLSLGFVNILAFIILVPVTAAVAPTGARIAHSINHQYLRYAFSIFLLITAVNMFLTRV